MGEWIDRGFAYKTSKVGEGKGPGLVVLMEAYGVNDHFRNLTERFSRWGLTAIAPDLYNRLPSDRRIVPYSDRETAMSNLSRVKDGEVREDIVRAISLLNKDKNVDPERIGVVGYCMGGRLAFLSAEWFGSGLKAVACFYGGGIGAPKGYFPGQTEVPLAGVDKISAPLLLLYGEEDTFIPEGERSAVSDALRSAGKKFQMVTYSGAGHGFFCEDRPSYHPESAHASEKVLREFLLHSLKDQGNVDVHK